MSSTSKAVSQATCATQNLSSASEGEETGL